MLDPACFLEDRDRACKMGDTPHEAPEPDILHYDPISANESVSPQPLPQLKDQLSGQPRARGLTRVSTRLVQGQSALHDLRQSGSMRVLFPKGRPHVEAVLLNTAGGITGGDRFDVAAHAKTGSALCVTTQAAERAYKANGSEPGRIENTLTIGADAQLSWLPQETILFEGCNHQRRLTVEMDKTARLLLCEPVIFGRRAMGERLHNARFADRIAIFREGKPLYLDTFDLSGDLEAIMNRPAVGQRARAMASVVFIAPDAEAQLAPLRASLPVTAGATLIGEDMLVLRLLAGDGFDLRTALIPVLDHLAPEGLPLCWRL